MGHPVLSECAACLDSKKPSNCLSLLALVIPALIIEERTRIRSFEKRPASLAPYASGGAPSRESYLTELRHLGRCAALAWPPAQRGRFLRSQPGLPESANVCSRSIRMSSPPIFSSSNPQHAAARCSRWPRARFPRTANVSRTPICRRTKAADLDRPRDPRQNNHSPAKVFRGVP